jgi:hypothetical protein
MAKQETKRQHFVPRTYLKRFAVDRDGQFFIKALPIAEPTQDKIREVSTRNIGLERDVYTLPGDTEEQRQLIERFYSDNYEKHYDKVYEILTDPAKKTVTDDERKLIISTVVTMFYRTTKWISSHNEFMKRVIHDMFGLAKQAGTDYFMFEKEKISIAGKTEQQLFNEFKLENRPAQVLTQLEVALKLIEIRSIKDGINVIKLADGVENEFITSDNPVSYFRVGVNEIMPFDPKNVLSLPLDNKHRLTLMPYADNETKNLIVRSVYPEKMSYSQKLTANFEQWRNAERFILGTDSGLKSYLSTKEETERPLTPEELKKLEPRQKAFEEVLKKAKDMGLI